MTLNNKTISEIAQKSPTAEDFFTYAACRERHVRGGVSKLPDLRTQMKQEGFEPVPQDLLIMFRELHRAGVGELKGDTFKWNTSIKKVGEAVIGKTEILESKPAKTTASSRIEKALVVWFDNKKHVSITFTPNLTKDEVSFLASKLLRECE